MRPDRKCWHGEYFYGYPLIPDLTVYDPKDLTIHTGILDADGKEIVRRVKGIGPIGFINFNDGDTNGR